MFVSFCHIYVIYLSYSKVYRSVTESSDVKSLSTVYSSQCCSVPQWGDTDSCKTSMSSKTVISAPHVSERRAYGINRIKSNTIAISAGILREGYGQKVQFLPEGTGVMYARRRSCTDTHVDAHTHMHQSPSLPHHRGGRRGKKGNTFACHKCVHPSASPAQRRAI